MMTAMRGVGVMMGEAIDIEVEQEAPMYVA